MSARRLDLKHKAHQEFCGDSRYRACGHSRLQVVRGIKMPAIANGQHQIKLAIVSISEHPSVMLFLQT